MYRTRNTNKQKILLEQDKRIFATSDLAVLWNIENKNTLWTTINRYIKRKILYKIHKGPYSTLPLEKLDKYELGCAVSGYLSYISAKTVLQNSGIIMQNITKITLFGKKKKELTISLKAVADTLHISPQYYFDNKIAIDMKKINILSKKVGYK